MGNLTEVQRRTVARLGNNPMAHIGEVRQNHYRIFCCGYRIHGHLLDPVADRRTVECLIRRQLIKKETRIFHGIQYTGFWLAQSPGPEATEPAMRDKTVGRLSGGNRKTEEESKTEN